MATELVLSPEEWISNATINFICIIYNVLILKTEIRNRQATDLVITSKIMYYIPMIAFTYTVIANVFRFAQYFNGFCYVSFQISVSLRVYFNMMGLYQIARLYYCFAQSQVHSNMGYPNWLIYTLYVIGIVTTISRLGIWRVYAFPTNCGINSQYQYFATFANGRRKGNEGKATKAFAVSMTIELIWDMTTLCLYVYKVLSFRKYKTKDPDVHKRIMAILNRILLLTIVYEMTYLLFLPAGALWMSYSQKKWINTIFSFAYGLASTLTLYSLFLMQQHNTSEYLKFLRFTYRLGIYHCCLCCFKSIVKNEIEMDSQGELENVIENVKEIKCETTEDTINTATTVEIKKEHSKMPELSEQSVQ